MTDDIDFGAAMFVVPKEAVMPEGKEHLSEEELEEETLPAVQEFDTVPVASRLEFYRQELNLILERAKSIKIIRDDDTNAQAIEWASQAKKLHKRLEDLRHHFVDPHHHYKTTVDRFFKPFTSGLEEIQKYLSRLAGQYRTFLENERKRIQAEQDAAAKKLEEQQEAEAKAAAEEGVFFTPTPVPQAVIPEVPKSIHTPSGSASQRERWTFEVVDESLIDREFLMVDEKKIRERIKGGLRESPGLRIYNEYITQIRT